MSVSDADAKEAIRRVSLDVQSTLDRRFGDLVIEIAADVRRWNAHLDRDEYVVMVAEAVQQELHDTFVHTTWPPCPYHHQHPPGC